MTRKRIKQSPKLPADERRQQLLEAAFTLFMKKGYQATTTDDIARSVGLTKGALYFHFKNKDELLLEVVRGIGDQIMEAIRAIPEAEATPSRIFKVMITGRGKLPTSDFACYLDFWGQATKRKKVRKFLQEMFDQYDQLVTEKLRHTFGGTARERREMAILIGAIYDGLWSRTLVSEKEINMNRIIRLVDKITPALNRKRPV